MKQETMDHIIQTIHLIRSRFDNQVHFIIGGDVNRTNYQDVLDSYGALKQCVSVSTRKDAMLTMILSDLHTLYHPPTTLSPLQVDSTKTGKDSDHDMIIFAPKSNSNFKVIRKKKIIKSRPLPDSVIPAFGTDIQNQTWQNVISEENLDMKVLIFIKLLLIFITNTFLRKPFKYLTLTKSG